MSAHSAYMIELAFKARLPFDQRIRKEVEEAKCFLANHDFHFPARASTCSAQCTEMDHTRAMPGCYRSMNACTKRTDNCYLWYNCRKLQPCLKCSAAKHRPAHWVLFA